MQKETILLKDVAEMDWSHRTELSTHRKQIHETLGFCGGLLLVPISGNIDTKCSVCSLSPPM